MHHLLLVGLGSFAGGMLRYLVSQIVQSRSTSAFPFGTLAVNIAGCFLIGIVFGLCEKGSMNQELRLFLATGILGGFTTFSAFSHETFDLIRHQQVGYAIAYVAASVLIGVLVTFIGSYLARAF